MHSKVKELELLLQIERDRVSYLSNYFNNVIDTMSAGIIITDEDLFITAVNKPSVDLLQIEQDELEGLPISEVINLHIFSFDEPNPDLHSLHGHECEVQIQQKDSGEIIPIHLTVSTLSYEDGEVEGLVCVLHDLRERKQLERQLLQSQKLESVGQLAAGIAHEINTPIQYIRDNMIFLSEEFKQIVDYINDINNCIEKQNISYEFLKSEIDKKVQEKDLIYLLEEIPNAVSQTLQGAEAVAKIVRSMKEFSHPGSEEKVLIDINAAIESTTIVCKSEWKYLAEIKLNFEDNLPKPLCYPGELNQVFLNIIINSAHAIGDMQKKDPDYPGEIVISTSSTPTHVVVKIKDNGSGIPDSIKEKIFNPFFTTKEVGKGTGQGLTFAFNTIVERHQGKLDFISEAGKGTEFIISLPLLEG